MIKRAVIPTAGRGTRFMPATKAIPKAMIPIVDRPTVQYVVDEALASGIEEILIIISPNGEPVKHHFDDKPNIKFVVQTEARGLGAAIGLARDFCAGESFAVLLGDDVVYNSGRTALGQLIDAHEKFGGSIIGVQTVPREKVSSYGIAEGSQVEPRLIEVSRMVEKPNPDAVNSRLGILGRYVLNYGIFDAIDKTQPGKGGEIQLTDALEILSKSEKIYAYDFEGRRYDAGNKLGFLEAAVEYALRREDLGERFENYLRGLIKFK